MMTTLDKVWARSQPNAAFWTAVVLRFAVRAMIAVMLGLIGAAANSILNVSGLAFPEAALLIGFVVAAIMTATLGRGLQAVLWAVILSGLGAFYQIALYLENPATHPITMLMPHILAALILAVIYSGKHRSLGPIFWLWIVCSIPAAISGALNPDIELSVTIVFLFVNVFCPLIFYCAFKASSPTLQNLQAAASVLSLGILALSIAPLLLIPFEFSARGQASFASLQVGGRAYAVIGAIFLLWPVLVTTLRRWHPLAGYGGFALIALLVATSFSRGAILGGAVLILAVTASRGQRFSSALNIGIVALGLVLLIAAVVPDWVEDLSRFWLLRANLASNSDPTLTVTFNLADFLSGGREDIWRIAIDAFMQKPFMGHGIGSTSSIIGRHTYGLAGYGSMHNILLTVAVERGFFGLLAVLVVLGRIVWVILTVNDLPGGRWLYLISFAGFILFAGTTGVELFMNSSREKNVTLAIYLFAYLGYMEVHLATLGSRYRRRGGRMIAISTMIESTKATKYGPI